MNFSIQTRIAIPLTIAHAITAIALAAALSFPLSAHAKVPSYDDECDANDTSTVCEDLEAYVSSLYESRDSFKTIGTLKDAVENMFTFRVCMFDFWKAGAGLGGQIGTDAQGGSNVGPQGLQNGVWVHGAAKSATSGSLYLGANLTLFGYPCMSLNNLIAIHEGDDPFNGNFWDVDEEKEQDDGPGEKRTCKTCRTNADSRWKDPHDAQVDDALSDLTQQIDPEMFINAIVDLFVKAGLDPTNTDHVTQFVAGGGVVEQKLAALAQTGSSVPELVLEGANGLSDIADSTPLANWLGNARDALRDSMDISDPCNNVGVDFSDFCEDAYTSSMLVKDILDRMGGYFVSRISNVLSGAGMADSLSQDLQATFVPLENEAASARDLLQTARWSHWENWFNGNLKQTINALDSSIGSISSHVCATKNKSISESFYFATCTASVSVRMCEWPASIDLDIDC